MSVFRGPTKIHLLQHRGHPARDVLERVARAINSRRGPLVVCDDHESVPDRPGDEPRPWDELFGLLRAHRQRRQIPAAEVVCLLTPCPNEFNWFSAVDHPLLISTFANCPPSAGHAQRNIFIHTEGWDWITSAPLDAVLAYEVIQNVLLHGLLEWAEAEQVELGDRLGMRHRTPRGCMNDLCGDKHDFTFKLRTADICAECTDLYEAAGASAELMTQVSSILEDCRRSALNTASYLPREPTYVRWAYPVAVTRHKATQTQDPYHRLKLLVDHFDAMVRYACFVDAAVGSRQPIDVGDRPALGTWVQELSSRREGLKGIKAFVRIAEHHGLVSLRNEDLAHGFADTEVTRYESLCKELEAALAEAESNLEMLFLQPLVIVEGLSLTDGAYHLAGKRLCGSNALFPEYVDKLPDGKLPRDAGLRNVGRQAEISIEHEGRFVSLSPHVVRATCGECAYQRILLFDGHRGADDVYIDVQRGHRTSRPAQRPPP